MKSDAHCDKTISLFASHRTHWTATRRNMLKLKKSVSQLSLAWKSGTSTCTEDTTSRYIQIINRSRQSSRSFSAKPLDDGSEWCSSYKDINFQFDTKKEKNFTLPTLSRAPVTYHPSTTSAKSEYEVFRMELAEMDIEPNRVTSETMQRIKQETA